MTKIFTGGRGSGKTTKCIEESARTGRYILVPNRAMAKFLYAQSLEMGVSIPFPVTIKDLEGPSPSIRKNGLIVDETTMVLEKILGVRIHFATVNDEKESAQ